MLTFLMLIDFGMSFILVMQKRIILQSYYSSDFSGLLIAGGSYRDWQVLSLWVSFRSPTPSNR